MHHSHGAEHCRTTVYKMLFCFFSGHVFCESLMAAVFCAVGILRASCPGPSGQKGRHFLRDVVHGKAFSQCQATWRCFFCTSSQGRKMTIKKLGFGGGLQVWLRSSKLLQPFLSRVFHDGAGAVVSKCFENKWIVWIQNIHHSREVVQLTTKLKLPHSRQDFFNRHFHRGHLRQVTL